MHKNKLLCCLLFLLVFLVANTTRIKKPTVFIIGDSTVKNGQGDGRNGQWGWGSFFSEYVDTTAIAVENRALGGTSTRTFITKGLWKKTLESIKPGDFLIIQFGHNDGSPLNDTARARGTIKGTGDEQREIYNPIAQQQEVVHTYGWYIRKFIREAKEKKAGIIICSPVPRNNFKNGMTIRQENSYTQWASEVAKQERVAYINLQDRIADEYDKLGEQAVSKLFPDDHTHTDKAGAQLNARVFIEQLKKLKENHLNKFIN